MDERAMGADVFRTGMADSLMREIGGLLETLARTGVPAALDLRSLPMTAADRDELAARLGRGEVDILFDVAGESEAWETAYAGVWWVRHYGADLQVAVERIEIGPVPEMLAASQADIAAAARRMAGDLEDDGARADAEETAHG